MLVKKYLNGNYKMILMRSPGIYIGLMPPYKQKHWEKCNVYIINNIIIAHQKINHFPGMFSLSRKNHLGRNLMKMRNKFPYDYKFFP